MNKRITGYHFTGATLRNGEPIPKPGEWLVHNGLIVPCSSGLHASVKVLDALQYAPGPMLHKVILEGELQSHGDPIDKYVGRRRKILASIDATNLLRDFARWCALSVIDKWAAPDVVRKYLKTGDKKLRDAASAAAWSAASSAAKYAAWSAACAAARAAARAAAWDAAWDAARAAARAAAWDAARDAQDKHLQRMVKEALKGL